MKTKFNKLIALAAATTLFANVASAEIKVGELTLTPGIIFESARIDEFAAVISNRSKASAGVDLNIAHNSGFYLYSEYNQDKIFNEKQERDGEGNVDYAFCNSLGFAKSIDKLNFDLSFKNCNFDGSKKGNPDNAGGYITRASYNVNDSFLVGGAYALSDTRGDFFKGEDSGVRVGRLGEYAYKGYGTFNAGPADITLTYGAMDGLNDYYKVGLSKEVVGINLDLSYWDVSGDSNLNKAGPTTRKKFDKEFLVLTVKKKF